MVPITALPRVLIEVSGQRLPDIVSRSVSAVTVQQRLSAPSVCEIVLQNPDAEFDPHAMCPPGLKLELFLGSETEPLFTGEVTAIEQEFQPSRGREVRVRGYDLLHRLRKNKSIRAFTESSVADIAGELAADLGLTVSSDTAPPRWERLIQYRHTDLDFLLDVTARLGLFVTLRGSVLSLLTAEGSGDAVSVRLGRELLEANVVVDGDRTCRSVRTYGWDPAHIGFHEGTASEARLGYDAAARVLPQDVGGSGEYTFTNETSADSAYAAALAQSELDRRAASELTLTAVLAGSHDVRAGSRIAVEGLHAQLDGEYVVALARHVVDRERGYVTEISTELPPRRPRDTGFLAIPGKVSRTDDPEKLGRVRLTLPTLADLETDWMCVTAAGAGGSKGLMALPDVDDHVFALVSAENPAVGIVVGSVYGSGGWPDTGLEDNAVKRFTWLTPGGQRFRFDDTNNSVRVENKSGSYVELLPDHLRLHSVSDMTIEAPGRTIVIQGKLIDFRSV